MNDENSAVILLDTVGELSEIYAASDVAFVGGSLIPRGGHNVLEPVLRGVPVLCGPHMANFQGAAQFVQSENLGARVDDENQLLARLEYWLNESEERAAFPERARLALVPHQGAPQRIAEHIAEKLKSIIESQGLKTKL